MSAQYQVHDRKSKKTPSQISSTFQDSSISGDRELVQRFWGKKYNSFFIKGRYTLRK